MKLLPALLLPFAVLAQGVPPPGEAVGSLERPAALPAALAGCWASGIDEAGSGEQWMAPSGGSMLGVSRTVKGGRTVFFEFMLLEQRDDGRLQLQARPKGQPPATFSAIEAGPQQWVFENRAHDFPHRIVYRLAERDVLDARIEGLRPDGAWRVIPFPLRRVACP